MNFNVIVTKLDVTGSKVLSKESHSVNCNDANEALSMGEAKTTEHRDVEVYQNEKFVRFRKFN